MTTPHHPPTPDHRTGARDEEIDALARRAGAEVRRPAPPGFADGVRRARRRQQAVRAGLGSAALVAIVAVGAFALGRDDAPRTVVTATDPTNSIDAPEPTRPTTADTTDAPTDGTSPTSVPVTSPVTVPATGSTAPPDTTAAPTTDPGSDHPAIPGLGDDPDGVPDAIYVAADDGFAQQHVLDPETLEIRDTLPITVGEEPPVRWTSASGAVTYAPPAFDAERDACNQTQVEDWVSGAAPSGLPAWVTEIVVSTDGSVGAVVSADCPDGVPAASDGGPGGSYEVRVAVFDPDRPDLTATTAVVVDGAEESPQAGSLELSDDGTYLLVSTTPRPFREGIETQIRVVHTRTAMVVAAIGDEQSGDLPRTDCGLGFVGMDLVSPTAIAYAAICPDGLAVVIHDLETGETYEEVQSAYAGRTYETMPGSGFAVDRATFRGPTSAWFILCADRESEQADGTTVIGAPGSEPCWLGRTDGNGSMREIPADTTIQSSFEPLG